MPNQYNRQDDVMDNRPQDSGSEGFADNRDVGGQPASNTNNGLDNKEKPKYIKVLMEN